MVKIDYDVDALVGDLISKEEFIIDLIGCREYNFWYLLRQAGVKSYAPVIGTISFLFVEEQESIHKVINAYKKNVFQLFENACRYCNGVITQYDDSKRSYEEFIKEGIRKGRFVFAIYDTQFDSSKVYDVDDNDLHGYTLVGFDDEKEEYLSILSKTVKYRDLDQMIQTIYCKEGTYQNLLYYIDSIEGNIADQMFKVVKKDFLEDIENEMKHWESEFRFFDRELEEMMKSEFLSVQEQLQFAKRRNQFYHWLMVGGYGNFIFKLRLIKELYGIDTGELEERFLQNRKQSLVIANMFRKALIRLERNQSDYYRKQLPIICDKVNQVYIEEGKALKDIFCSEIYPLMKERS